MKTRILARAVVALAIMATSATSARAELMAGLTTTAPGGAAGVNVVTFDSTAPGTFLTNVALSGVTANESVVCLDFRPATSTVYAMSRNNTVATDGTIYTVNLTTGALTTVASYTNMFPGNTASRISLDFNPVVDRMRVVTASGQNYRFNPNDGSFVASDGALAYDAGDVNFPNNPPFIVGAAYTNNFAGAGSTTLYVWDFNLDVLATQGSLGGSPVSPNTGTLFTVGGPPGFIVNSGNMGFDISGGTGTAFIQYSDFANGTTQRLATVNLGDGTVTNIGTFGTNMLDITAVPEPSTMILCGLAGAGIAARAIRRRKTA